jgi:hypothetical protein
MEENNVGFSRLNLKEGDSLIVKLDTSNMTEEESSSKLKEIREDQFIKYVESRGHNVFVTYSGIDLNILRLGDSDKVVAYANVTDMSEDEESKYIDYIDFKLKDQIGEDRLVIVPVRKNSPILKITTKEEINEY